MSSIDREATYQLTASRRKPWSESLPASKSVQSSSVHRSQQVAPIQLHSCNVCRLRMPGRGIAKSTHRGRTRSHSPHGHSGSHLVYVVVSEELKIVVRRAVETLDAKGRGLDEGGSCPERDRGEGLSAMRGDGRGFNGGERKGKGKDGWSLGKLESRATSKLKVRASLQASCSAEQVDDGGAFQVRFGRTRLWTSAAGATQGLSTNQHQSISTQDGAPTGPTTKRLRYYRHAIPRRLPTGNVVSSMHTIIATSAASAEVQSGLTILCYTRRGLYCGIAGGRINISLPYPILPSFFSSHF